jgi:protein involved in polysaccharide export with SLBB domain
LNLDFEQTVPGRGSFPENVAMEPDDYLYVASSDVNEVYVVGEVRLPGAVTYRPDMNIIGAISSRGGYTDRAFKKRVVVVRGSLGKARDYCG